MRGVECLILNTTINAVSTSLNIGQQSFKKFGGYIRSVIHFHKYATEQPYLMLDLHTDGDINRNIC